MKAFYLAPFLFVFLLVGCQNPNDGWNPDQVRVFLPEVHDLSAVVTKQALMNKPDEVRVAVNLAADGVYDALSADFQVDATQVASLVDMVFSKVQMSDNVKAVAKPIVTSVLFVGLQSIEAKINEAGQNMSDNNALVVDFVKAAASGIRDGSAAPVAQVRGQFVLPLNQDQRCVKPENCDVPKRKLVP